MASPLTGTLPAPPAIAAAIPAPVAAADTGDRTRFAFLAETSRCLADSLDFETTLATAAGLALPHFGAWCMVDIVEADGSISRVAVIHPDPEKQRLARDFYETHPPHRTDPIGAPRVIRTHHSEFAPVADVNVIEGVADAELRDLLRRLGAQSVLTVPMRARGRMLGAITFVSDEYRSYDDADLLLAEDLGRRCAMAIDNALLYRDAEATRRSAEAARETATFAAQRANTLRELADGARHEAEAANRAKATFLTTMSHEFRTPLTAVLGFVGLLTDGLAGPLTPQQHDYVRRIGNASGNLLRLIEEVLTLSQVHAGKGTVLVEEVDLGAIVREVAELLAPLAQAKRVHIVVDATETPLVAVSDGSKLRQIVINLVGNAVKYTEVGEVRLTQWREADDLVLRVRDTGAGMSSEDAERIFEPFTQAWTPGARPARGTGLGLAITRQLTELLGGTVSVESALGKGSTFTVRVPAESGAGLDGEARRDWDRRVGESRERRAYERSRGRPADA